MENRLGGQAEIIDRREAIELMLRKVMLSTSLDIYLFK